MFCVSACLFLCVADAVLPVEVGSKGSHSFLNAELMKNLDAHPSALLWRFISSLAVEQQVLGLPVAWLFLYFSSGLCFLK